MRAPAKTADETAAASTGEDALPDWTIDELAALVALPVRTIREYQTFGILPAPRREGRVGLYGTSHLRRLQLISRLRDRGYSLAGIGDLIGNWSSGADLGEVLGLQPDQLVHVDEPGAPATLDQLQALLPALIPDHLDDLESAGIVERCQPARFCIPSPSLLQLTIDSLDAGLGVDDVIAMLGTIHQAAELVASQVVEQISHLPAHGDPDAAAAFLRRGRGLLAHGVGRLTLHRVGRKLGVGDEADLEPTLRDLIEKRADPT
jgi:DNA-binding transcriptional MerR regulator